MYDQFADVVFCVTPHTAATLDPAAVAACKKHLAQFAAHQRVEHLDTNSRGKVGLLRSGVIERDAFLRDWVKRNG